MKFKIHRRKNGVALDTNTFQSPMMKIPGKQTIWGSFVSVACYENQPVNSSSSGATRQYMPFFCANKQTVCLCFTLTHQTKGVMIMNCNKDFQKKNVLTRGITIPPQQLYTVDKTRTIHFWFHQIPQQPHLTIHIATDF